MNELHTRPTLLIVEDNRADVDLLKELFGMCGFDCDLHFVKDGFDASDFLKKDGAFPDAPTPNLVLMDLNLPRKGGRDLLREIRQDPSLRAIPVLVLSTSNSQQDVVELYALGANGFCAKPVDLMQFLEVIRGITHFWLQVAEIPYDLGYAPPFEPRAASAG